MHADANPAERQGGEYLLFAGAFLGFIIASAGVVLASEFLALSGLCLMLLSLGGFALGAQR
jgi:hypothetical protein